MEIPSLPTTATAPFCPSEVQGSVVLPTRAPLWKKFLLFAGPGLLVSVGYMDPGNWATDIEAGSKYGPELLFVVVFSSLAAMLLQTLCVRLGIASGQDLASLSRLRFPKALNLTLWALAEIAIIATDIAEVLGCALAFKLLLGVSLQVGVLVTALDTVLVLGLKGRGFRQIEAIILGLILTISLCFCVEIFLISPQWKEIGLGLVPSVKIFSEIEPWYLAIGILGATVMPHNLYLHTSIVQTRRVENTYEAKKNAITMNISDTVVSLSFALLVNAAILILAATAFHAQGHANVTSIDDAYHLLDPVVGSSLAGLLFGIALLASGQSSTFTGTIAGQTVMDGFLQLKIPCWKRRLITRGLALIPAFIGISIFGEHSTGQLLVLSQVLLSLQLPFAIAPLILFSSQKDIMGPFALRRWTKGTAWLIFAVVTFANLWLLWQLFFQKAA